MITTAKWRSQRLPVRRCLSALGSELLLCELMEISRTCFQGQCPWSYRQKQISGSGNIERKGDAPFFSPTVFYVLGGAVEGEAWEEMVSLLFLSSSSILKGA